MTRKKTIAGELASFLLGKTNDIKSEEVKQIADTFKKSYEEFRNDKEVKRSMSVAEKLRMEGRLEGIEEGIQQGIKQAMAKLTELVNAGLSVEDALKEMNGSTT